MLKSVALCFYYYFIEGEDESFDGSSLPNRKGADYKLLQSAPFLFV
jgi:hypothetical protein